MQSLFTTCVLCWVRIDRYFPSGAIIFVIVCVMLQACSPSSDRAGSAQDVDFQSPTRIAISESGIIYVSDHKKGYVEILNDEGRKIGDLRGFASPLGIAVVNTSAPTGFISSHHSRDWTYVFVGDTGNGSVQVYKEGRKVGVLGSGSSEFIMPNGIAVTTDLTSYVVDSKANQVMVYDSSGVQQTVFGSSGFNFPTDIALNEAEGELYVTDFNNKRIRVYDLSGSWLRDIYAPLNDPDDIYAPFNDQGDPVFWKPAGIGIDSEGNLYVVDNALSSVAKINSQGDLLQTIGYSEGQYWTGELSIPVDAAAYGTKIYVTSNGQRELRIFEVTP